jgi:nucleoid-associated protein YgaU
MTQVDCPVCGKTDLAAHLVQCPQCNADLECFRLLEALYEEPSTPGVETEVVRSLSRRVEDIGPLLQRLQDGIHQWQRAAKRRTAMLILVSVMLGLVSAAGAWLLYVRWDTPPEQPDVMSSAALLAALTRERPQEKALREAVANAVAGIEHVSQQIAALEQRVAELAPQPPAMDTKDPSVAASAPAPAVLYHAPRQNESLWLIAHKYYQQGRLYPALLETNPGLGIYFAPDYGQLRLPSTRQAAEAIVAQVVFSKDARRFLRYQVQVADTWQSIAARFYGRGDDAARLQALNADAPLQPGTRVVVPLPE